MSPHTVPFAWYRSSQQVTLSDVAPEGRVKVTEKRSKPEVEAFTLRDEGYFAVPEASL